jgi:PST family polysaccharide transporter
MKNIKMPKLTSTSKRLANNALMLYILTFSNYFLFLITIPYQTRILGPTIFGAVGFAMAFTAYFQILIDFGFMISATEIVSRHRDDKDKVSSVLSAVTWCKIVLAIISGLIMAVLCLTVEQFRSDALLYILFFISSVLASFVPDFIYRGMENMRAITIRTVAIRLFFTLMIFIFLKKGTDYYVIPILGIIGNVGALVLVAFNLKSLGIRFSKVSLRELKDTFKQSSFFFYSRIATNIYSATNIFMLGLIYGPATQVVGYYTSADRLITAAKQGVSPVIDSLYPYMVKHRDFKLVKKVLVIGLPVMAVGCGLVAIFAEPICVLLFGEPFRASGEYLRLLTPVAFIAFPAMLFGFPVLTPMGLSKYANMSNVIGAGLQIVQIAILFGTGHLTVVNICIITCITEIATLSYRLYIVWKNRHLLSYESKAPGQYEASI